MSSLYASQAVSQPLADAAAVAGFAPSIHNTQPWRWRLTGDRLDLHIDHDRLLEVADPDSRLATLSCGAALHHVRIGLAAQGWHATVARRPEPADPNHLARLKVDGRAEVDERTARLMRAIPLRHTDRLPVTGIPVGDDDLREISAAVRTERTWVHVLGPEQLPDLAAAADHARRTQTTEPAWRAELAYWTGENVPDSEMSRPASARRDRSAVFVVLCGPGDEPLDWLRAGEALSAAWLTATGSGVAVTPLSALVEVARTREAVRRLVAHHGYPYLVLRLGAGMRPGADPPDAPRQPTDQIIERSTSGPAHVSGVS